MSYKEIKARHQDNLDHGWADNGEEACDDRGELLTMVEQLQSQLEDAEKTRLAIAHIRDKKSTEARHRYEVAEAQLDKVAVEAYSIGYESGHNDTVESVYCGDSMERAEEWWDEHSESITGDKK